MIQSDSGGPQYISAVGTKPPIDIFTYVTLMLKNKVTRGSCEGQEGAHSIALWYILRSQLLPELMQD